MKPRGPEDRDVVPVEGKIDEKEAEQSRAEQKKKGITARRNE